VQLHHGTADTSVPLQFSQTLEQQIRDAGGSVELFVYPGDDHNLAANLPRALARSVAFFDAHVKGRGGS
jgi:dipeptidyl aminopeptidase/acylaminoacyl peptidase